MAYPAARKDLMTTTAKHRTQADHRNGVIIAHAGNGDTQTLIVGANTRRAWSRAARKTGQSIFRRGTTDPMAGAVADALREGGSLLEEWAVRRATKRLLRDLGAGRIQPMAPIQVLPGVSVLVESLNDDGSADLARISYRSPSSRTVEGS